MVREFPLLLLLVGVLAACNRESAQPATTPATPPQSNAVVVSLSGSLKAFGQAHVNGYGHLRFGMTADEAKQAWGGELNGKPGPGEICYYLTPKWVKTAREFSFTVESDKFVRHDVGNDKEVAPGGGKRGMGVDEIRKLYAGRFQETPHKYVKGGSYLRIKSHDESGGVLLFETDADGKVSAWRVGQAPQVDYVEGCS